jgi:hypothetical protein
LVDKLLLVPFFCIFFFSSPSIFVSDIENQLF